VKRALVVAGALTALALATGASHAQGGSLQARVMVLPAPGATGEAKLPADVLAAVSGGARRVTPNVARSTASLTDTAVIVGCDPQERACLEAVAAALNVDQMLLVNVRSEAGGDVTVDVTAVSRDSAPVTKQFVVRAATRKQDLATIEAAVPEMLDAEARGAGTGTDTGTGTETATGTETGTGTDPETGTGTDPGTGTGTGGPVDEPRVSSTRAPMLVTIAGGALAVIGLGAWGLAAAKQGDIDGAPTSSAADLERLADMERTGRTYATTGNVLVVAGGLAAVAGAVWWWKADQARGVTVSPMVGGDAGGVVLGGRW